MEGVLRNSSKAIPEKIQWEFLKQTNNLLSKPKGIVEEILGRVSWKIYWRILKKARGISRWTSEAILGRLGKKCMENFVEKVLKISRRNLCGGCLDKFLKNFMVKFLKQPTKDFFLKSILRDSLKKNSWGISKEYWENCWRNPWKNYWKKHEKNFLKDIHATISEDIQER